MTYLFSCLVQFISLTLSSSSGIYASAYSENTTFRRHTFSSDLLMVSLDSSSDSVYLHAKNRQKISNRSRARREKVHFRVIFFKFEPSLGHTKFFPHLECAWLFHIISRSLLGHFHRELVTQSCEFIEITKKKKFGYFWDNLSTFCPQYRQNGIFPTCE